MEEKKSLLNETKTKTGEFICSYFAWLTLDGQKEKVEELENITNEKDV
ncbi:MAG: hypothetical protein Q4G05_01030 [Clostridia bacterium]|nr:hypothetical protein [Clostridia bacterium]